MADISLRRSFYLFISFVGVVQNVFARIQKGKLYLNIGLNIS